MILTDGTDDVRRGCCSGGGGGLTLVGGGTNAGRENLESCIKGVLVFGPTKRG